MVREVGGQRGWQRDANGRGGVAQEKETTMEPFG
jgi:hypothetical protein